MKTQPANIYVADKIDESGIDFLKRKDYNVFLLYGLQNDELIKKISEADNKHNLNSALIIRSVRKIGKEELDSINSHTRIRFISTASSGFDNIDYEYAKKLGIKIINVPDGNFISAAEHTMALILGIFKHICNPNKISSVDFINSIFTNHELYNKSIGIIGVGRVGSHLAKLCKAFKMKIYGNDIKENLANKYPWIRFCSLNELVRSCDIITVHTPLDETTRNLINGKLMKQMKRGVVLINCARGGIINEKSLIENLKGEKISYAGVDVFINEPDINKGFLPLKNVLLTPHQAGKTVESRVRISNMLAERLHAEMSKRAKKKKT